MGAMPVGCYKQMSAIKDGVITVAYLGGHWAMAPLAKTIFFSP